MTLDPQLAAVLTATADNPPLTGFPPARARELFEQLTAGLHAAAGEPPAVGVIEDGDVDGVPIRVYRPADVDGPVPTVVFVHGGGWVIGSIASHDDHARRLCRDLDAVVVSVGYRLAPEDPFPAGLEDCVTVFDHVVTGVAALGGDPARLAVAGDSAGGNLAAVLALHARDAGVALAGQLLIYPATDSATEYPSMTENAEGYFLSRADMEWFSDQYLGADHARATDPRVSPARAPNLAGVAPAVVVTAQFDPLRDSGEAYADLLAAVGVPVVRRRFDGLVHGFFGMGGMSAACADAVDWTVAQFRTVLQG